MQTGSVKVARRVGYYETGVSGQTSFSTSRSQVQSQTCGRRVSSVSMAGSEDRSRC